jgi:hypothetical protein
MHFEIRQSKLKLIDDGTVGQPGGKEIPWVIAGPILRRVDKDAVTVWLALNTDTTGILEIMEPTGPTDTDPTVIDQGTATSIELGEHLHILTITADVAAHLDPGKVYAYQISLQSDGLAENLFANPNTPLASTSYPEPDLTYGAFSFPTFSIPPVDLNKLRIVHGSCRKPHGEGHDAMVAVGRILDESVDDADARPHQLYLTGDQIYADDVADRLLSLATSFATTAMAEETLPDGKGISDSEIGPGERSDYVQEDGLSSGHAKSHLIGFGEYCATYLLYWSNVLWPRDSQTDNWPSDLGEEDENRRLNLFIQTLGTIRKVLANVPTYMIFDDHEVTDDWNLNHTWVERVVENNLSRQIIENGLAAYTVFQAWGNVPKVFAEATAPEKKFLEHIDGTDPDDFDRDKFETWFDIPRVDSSNDKLVWPREADIDSRIDFHFIYEGSFFETIFLDTRTWRGLSSDRNDIEFLGRVAGYSPAPELLADDAWERQFADPEGPPADLTFVISPAPIWGHPTVNALQEIGVNWTIADLFTALDAEGSRSSPEAADYEHWHLQPGAKERLLATLASRLQVDSGGPNRVIVLSGDVHYGLSAKTNYWARKPYKHAASDPARQAAIINFTSSSSKNEADNTREIGEDAYEFKSLFAEDPSPAVEQSDPGPEFGFFGWGSPDDAPHYDVLLAHPDFQWAWEADVSCDVRDDISKTPAITQMYEGTDLTNLESQHYPEWIYWADYLRNHHDLMPQARMDRLLDELIDADPDHKSDIVYYKRDLLIVGSNNFGEIDITWTDTEKSARQYSWIWLLPRNWQATSDDPNQVPAIDMIGPVAVTMHEAELELDGDPPEIGQDYITGGP